MDLISKDPVGPGFGVTGTVTDGIVVSSLHEKGPALQSGRIAVGESICQLLLARS